MATVGGATITPSPASNLFAIPELLEHILLNLDNTTLLLSQRVSRTWQQCIESSIHIQRKLFFAPATLDQMNALGMLHFDSLLLLFMGETRYTIINPLLIDSETLHTIGFRGTVDWPKADIPHKECAEYTWGSMELVPKLDPYGTIASEQHKRSAQETQEASGPSASTLMPHQGTTSLDRMFLTQPPLHSIACIEPNITFRIFDAQHQRTYSDERPKTGILGRLGESNTDDPDGVRIGWLMEKLRGAAPIEQGQYACVVLDEVRMADKAFEAEVEDVAKAMERERLWGREHGDCKMVWLRELARRKFKS